MKHFYEIFSKYYLFENTHFPHNKNHLIPIKYALRYILTILISYFFLWQALVFSVVLNYLGFYQLFNTETAYNLDYSIRLISLFLIPILTYIFVFSRHKVTFHIYIVCLIFVYLNSIVIDCFSGFTNKLLLYIIICGTFTILIQICFLKSKIIINGVNYLKSTYKNITQKVINNKIILKIVDTSLKYFISIWIYLNITMFIAYLISFEINANQYDVFETILKILMLFLLPIIYIVVFSRTKISLHPYIINFIFFILAYHTAPFPLYFILAYIFITTSVIQIIHLAINKLIKTRSS